MVLALAASACGPGSSRESPEPALKPGGALNVAIVAPESVPAQGSKTASIDPSRASSRSAMLVLKQICDPLVGFDPTTGALTPGAAESWTIAPDAKKITFTLRGGLKFHTGREVTASDYVFSMSRFVHPQNGSPLHFLLERVAGYREMREGRASELAGVRALDRRSLEVNLSEPFAELPAVLAHPAAGSAIPKEEVDKGAESFGAKPICTGPYALAGPWNPAREIKLVRYGDYGGSSTVYAGEGVGFADQINFRIVPDIQAGYLLLQQAEVQVAEVPPPRLLEARRRPLDVDAQTNGLVAYIGFPLRKPPFDNADFRRALAGALDRREIVEDLLGRSRRLAGGFLPPTAGSDTGESACRQTLPPTENLKSARAALTASGVNVAETNLNIHFNNGTSGNQIWLGKVAAQWKAGLGVASTLAPFPRTFQEYLDFLAAGSADGPFRLAWSVDFPSPEALLVPLFSSGALDNLTGYSNPTFDEAIRRARGAPDNKARQRAYGEAEQILCRDLPIIPMWFGLNHVGFSSSVRSAAKGRVDVFGDPRLRELGTVS
ncbi:MAG: peptide ABC transporter substrate-binding protein [Actinomycetota bacterium]